MFLETIESKVKSFRIKSSTLGLISTKINDCRLRRKIAAAKLFFHETIFSFHMNNFGVIIVKNLQNFSELQNHSIIKNKAIFAFENVVSK